MAITKILARKGRLDVGINYVLNGDKTQERVLTAHLKKFNQYPLVDDVA